MTHPFYVFFIGLLFSIPLLQATDYGMSSPVPIGKYANGVFPSSTPESGGWGLAPAFHNLKFDDVTVLSPAPNTDLFYAGSRSGVIQSFVNDETASSKTFVLDISSKVELVADGGLLGMAFHPEYGVVGSSNNEYLYLFYTAKGMPDPYLRLVRYRVPEATGVAEPVSELVLMNIVLRGLLHRGGGLTFGNDGFLYLSIGDQNDLSVSQDISSSLEGGVIRIDVDKDPLKSHEPVRRYPLNNPNEYTQEYWIPNDNPFIDPAGGIFEEYFSIGHRNPHRLANDPATGRLWIGEVGSERREEVNVINAGDNHGWPFLEGSVPGDAAAPQNLLGTVVGPVAEFGREDAQSLIGGYVYRGNEHPYLEGKYLCADYRLPHVFAISWDGSGVASVEKLLDNAPSNIVTLGQDSQGEVYFCRLGSQQRIYKLVQNQPSADPPSLLSQTGVFQVSSSTGNFQGMNLATTAGYIPYEVNSPLWSDGALKRRWVAIPQNGTADTPGEKVNFSETSPWEFPDGTVFVKHFELPVDDANPNVIRRLETRFLVQGGDDQVYGMTYRWRPDGSDADLLATGLDEAIEIRTSNGGTRSQVWQYPSRGSCLTCHNDQAGVVLGLRTEQLNGTMAYPSGVEDNQLRTWNHLQFFDPPFAEGAIGGMPRASKLEDPQKSVAHRVRSYLASNCAFCHQPATGNLSQFDARLKTPIEFQGLLNTLPANDLGVPGARLIKPGDPLLSTMFQRVHSIGSEKMPPLGRNVIDTEFASALDLWIRQLGSQGHPEKGLKAEYYDGNHFQQFVMSRIDAQVNFDWGQGGPDPALGNDLYSVRWTGFLNPEVSGNYTFRVVSDNGFRLWIDDQLVINSWDPDGGSFGFIVESGSMNLSADRPVSFKAEFYEDFQGAQVRLFWSAPGLLERIIPANAFAQSAPVNRNPVATEDVLIVNRGENVVGQLLENDEFTNGDLDYSSIEIVVPPQHGTISVEPWSARATYQHDGAGGHGTDVFAYRVSDTFGQVSLAAGVLIEIRNDPPVVKDDQQVVPHGGVSTVLVLANDSDPDDGIVPGSIQITSNGSQGTAVVIPETGEITYTHNGSAVTSDQYTYRVKDVTGEWSNTATVFVTIQSGTQGAIGVNGNLSDWGASLSVASDPADSGNAANLIDVLNIYLTHDDDEFFLAYLNAGPVTLNWGWSLFIDTDHRSDTGYVVGLLGADYILRDDKVYAYAGTGSDWSWSIVGTMTSAVGGSVAEFRFPRYWLGNPVSFDYFFFGDNTSSAGGTGGDLVPDNGYLTYSAEEVFRVDGILNEWDDSHFRVTDLLDVSIQGAQIDLKSLCVGEDVSRFYFAYENETATSISDGWMLFLDTDGSASTGYGIWGMGADVLIRKNEVFQHSGDPGTWAWQFKDFSALVQQGSVTEFAVPKAWMGNPSFLKMIFYGDNTIHGAPDQPDVIPDNPSNGPLVYGDLPPGINVDGSLADWPSASTSTIQDPVDAISGQDQLDLTSLSWHHGSDRFYLGYGNTRVVDLNTGWMLFLDTDRQTTTGYQLYNSGADYLIRGDKVYEYMGSGADWSWLEKGTMTSGFAGTEAEFSFPAPWLGGANGFDYIFFGDNSPYGGSFIETVPDNPSVPSSFGP